jgi:hypothetical protein
MSLIWNVHADSSMLNTWALTLDANGPQPNVRVVLDVLQRNHLAFATDSKAHRIFYMPAAISSSESHRLTVIIFRCLDKTMGLFERVGIGESEEAIDRDLLLTDMTAHVGQELPSLRNENGEQIIRII